MLAALGPSPRARGAHVVAAGADDHAGTIPACAGSTAGDRSTVVRSGDHPRVRGEHTHARPGSGPRPGPSPRARGAPLGKPGRAARMGTIPACAGSTLRGPGRRRPCRDHPRVRGEHLARSLSAATSLGPSPRARGARVDLADQAAVAGTIPACAGSTPQIARARMPVRDHPRVRGEHGGAGGRSVGYWGPSPRARGARSATRATVPTGGTIPACAGSTWARSPPLALRRDHPRVRGEHARSPATEASVMGPSPRARGAHPGDVVEVEVVGTIPACAGSTVNDLQVY